MRKICFRAWDKKNKRMVDVIDFTCMNYPKQYEVMQFTGLKDKNGKEVFESDIIEYLYISEQENEKRQAEVYYDKKSCGFFPFCFKQEYDRNVEIRDVEVIGNVYENPDIIKLNKETK